MNQIVYQNKDITSKIFAEKFKGKSLKVYGIDIPKVVEVLPTNLPDISANELRMDNLFLLESSYLSELNSKEISERLEKKIQSKKTLTEEEMMEYAKEMKMRIQ